MTGLTAFTILVALLVLVGPREGDSTFRWSREGDWFAIPDVSLPANSIVWTNHAVEAD